MGIGNVLFFSANEEINVGVPEECWPTGLYGNFFRFQHPIVNLVPTSDALYIITTKNVYRLSGSNLETFNPKVLINNIGGASGHPRAATNFGDTIIWLTNDLRIAILQGMNFRTISESLATDIVNLINTASAEIDIKYFAELDKEWIAVNAICPTPTNSRTWIYDVNKSQIAKKDFWNSPWNLQGSAFVSDRIRESQQQRRLAFFAWTGTTGFLARVATTAAENVGTDAIPGALTTPIHYTAISNLFEVAPGNHINYLRRPGVLPNIYAIVIERTKFTGDSDPTVTYFLSDLWTSPITPPVANGPARENPPLGYSTLIYDINDVGKRIAVKIDKSDTYLFELQNFSIIWDSDEGSSV
jgi:hypothetical protein